MSKEVYCELLGKQVGMLRKKVEIDVDLGNAKGILASLIGDPLRDEKGRVIQFNSMIDALNHMAAQGWRFVNAYCITTKAGENVYHYIMRKTVD